MPGTPKCLQRRDWTAHWPTPQEPNGGPGGMIAKPCLGTLGTRSARRATLARWAPDRGCWEEARRLSVSLVGWGDGSVLGTKVVMEVRAREAWAFKVWFERLRSLPERVYGVGLGSSYQHQTLSLSKHFRR
ncbi:MAG: hypothetical protein ACREIY_01220 [Candidatus Rokuibacteriota bacterium]